MKLKCLSMFQFKRSFICVCVRVNNGQDVPEKQLTWWISCVRCLPLSIIVHFVRLQPRAHIKCNRREAHNICILRLALATTQYIFLNELRIVLDCVIWRAHS